MQMGIDGNQIIDQLCQEAPDDLLTDRLPRVEGLVLSHITQVGCDQTDPLHAGLAECVNCQQQFNQFVVRPIKTLTDDHMRCWFASYVHQAFAIGKVMDLNRLVITA